MKVLYLTSPHADYGEALLFRGLAHVLGEDSIDDYPSKPTYHGEDTHTYAKGEVPHDPNHAGHTAKHPWFKPVNTAPLTTKVLVSRLLNKYYGLIVLGSCREAIWSTWRFLKGITAHFPPAVVTDHEDHEIVYTPYASEVRSPLYFKRDLRAPMEKHGIQVLPLPFSCAWGDYLEPSDPRAPRSGAFLSCSMTHAARHVAVGVLTGIQGIIVGENSKHGTDYTAAMRGAAIGISVRGHGLDTLRHWEVPFHGAVLLTDSEIAVPEDFIDGVDCLRYQDAGALGETVTRYLQRGDLADIAEKGQRRLLEHHTHVARAKYFLRIVEEYHNRALRP